MLSANYSQRRLIINADGYGFTPGVNRGIERTLAAGMIKSTSCTPNFGFLSQAGALARKFPEVSFGIHFNLSVGRPLTNPGEIPTLVGQNGQFLGSNLIYRICSGRVRVSEVVRELTAQAAMLADQGIPITHWDGHQNKHLWPLYFEAGGLVAKRFGIPGIRCHRRMLFSNAGPIPWIRASQFYAAHPRRILLHLGGRFRTWQARLQRFTHADSLISPGYVDHSDKCVRAFWEAIANTLPPGTHEVYCHPAEPDELLRANASYVEQRATELQILTDPELASTFSDRGIELVSFHALQKRAPASCRTRPIPSAQQA